MKLEVKRIAKKADYTIGKLYVDGEYFCDTLEDKVRDLSKEKKVYGQTAIPAGTYKVEMVYSPKFSPRFDGAKLPLIKDVSQFSGILIHSGNTKEDTSGCILVGKNKIVGGLIDSRKAMIELLAMFRKYKDEPIQIEVS
jgi:hypothetical protein